MNYKEVFELAQNKGYDLEFTNCDNFKKYIGAPSSWEFLECTLIQKWLRDTHGIDIEINNQFYNAKEGAQYFPVVYSPSIARQVLQNCGKYESALLAGINAALQLI